MSKNDIPGQQQPVSNVLEGFSSSAAFFRSLDLEDLKQMAQYHENQKKWGDALEVWNTVQGRLDRLAATTPSFQRVNPRYGQEVIDGIERCRRQLNDAFIPS